jgi:post-segregation antitoxin (ccd killing protein)
MVKRKVTVTVDEELIEAAKLGSESLSAVGTVALAAEVDRRARAAALRRTLSDWEAEFGAVDDQALLAARRAFDDLDGLAVGDEQGPTERSEVA